MADRERMADKMGYPIYDRKPRLHLWIEHRGGKEVFDAMERLIIPGDAIMRVTSEKPSHLVKILNNLPDVSREIRIVIWPGEGIDSQPVLRALSKMPGIAGDVVILEHGERGRKAAGVCSGARVGVVEAIEIARNYDLCVWEKIPADTEFEAEDFWKHKRLIIPTSGKAWVKLGWKWQTT